MYPLTLVRLSRNKYINFELKSGSKCRGFLKKCDLLMNLHIVNMNMEDIDGQVIFYKECYVRGTSIKTVNVDPSLLHLQSSKQ
ncbi:putative U6 snRNA-associated Sm-like protein [Vairimorpha necatrix]|uniref:U6 snRNA-associated Sm-like protein n=1 Tax=Vairimorpha necatrix TaxID=6039 RepID=A0AAX4JGH7_9MICR